MHTNYNSSCNKISLQILVLGIATFHVGLVPYGSFKVLEKATLQVGWIMVVSVDLPTDVFPRETKSPYGFVGNRRALTCFPSKHALGNVPYETP